MKFYVSFFLVISVISNVKGQVTVGGLQRNSIDLNMRPQGVIMELKPPVREAVGSTYVEDSWLIGKIDLANGQVINGYPMRYDILTDQVEVRIDGELRGVQGKNVKSLTLFYEQTQSKDIFVNGRYCKETVNESPGFYKVISNGEWSLLEKLEVDYEEPNYNPVLGVGNQEGRYVRKNKLYITNGKTIIPVVQKKGKFLESLGEQSSKVSAFMKKENLSLNHEGDVKLIVEFLNTES